MGLLCPFDSMGKGLLDGEVQGRFTKKRCFSYEIKRTPLSGELLSRDCLKRLLVLKQLCNLMKNYGRKSLGAFKPSWQTRTNWMVREQGSLSNFFSPAMGSLITLNISRCRERCGWHLELGSTTLFRLRFRISTRAFDY